MVPWARRLLCKHKDLSFTPPTLSPVLRIKVFIFTIFWFLMPQVSRMWSFFIDFFYPFHFLPWGKKMKTLCSISFSNQLLFLFSLFDFTYVTRIFGFFWVVVVVVIVVLHYRILLKCVCVLHVYVCLYVCVYVQVCWEHDSSFSWVVWYGALSKQRNRCSSYTSSLA